MNVPTVEPPLTKRCASRKEAGQDKDGDETDEEQQQATSNSNNKSDLNGHSSTTPASKPSTSTPSVARPKKSQSMRVKSGFL